MERRTLLGLGLGLLGSALVPGALVPGMRWGTPDDVAAEAERLEAAADAEPVGMGPRARADLREIELLLASSSPGWRMPLHRAAAEADREVSDALAGPPHQTTFVLCDLARLGAATGDLDAAAAHLEEALLLARTHRLSARIPRVLALRRDLPSDAAPIRRLDDVLGGGPRQDRGDPVRRS